MYGDDRVRPYAYTYRDYVIRAFNDDMPFDRFIARAARRRPRSSRKVEPWRLAALGFLTLGRQFDNNIHDVIDDRIDTVTRGFLGLTVACARCHDHKFDPIPTADYYSLYGVFANCEAPLEPPLADRPENCKTLAEYEKQAGPHRQKMQKMLDSQYALLTETARQRVGDYLRARRHDGARPRGDRDLLPVAGPDRFAAADRQRAGASTSNILPRGRSGFGPWPDLMKLPDATYAGTCRSRARTLADKPTAQSAGARRLARRRSSTSKADVARAYGTLLKNVYEQAKDKAGRRRRNSNCSMSLTSKQSPVLFPEGADLATTCRAAKRTPTAACARSSTRSPSSCRPRRRGPWCWPTRPTSSSRTSSCAAIRPCPARRCRASSCACWPATTGSRSQHGSGRLDLARAIAVAGQSAHQPRPRQSRLDAPLRRTARGHRPAISASAARRRAIPNCSIGWPATFMQRGLVAQETASPHRPVRDVSASELRPRGRAQDRSGESPVLACQSPPARPRSDARLAAGHRRPARSHRRMAGRSISSTIRRTRGARSTAWWIARACRGCSARSISRCRTNRSSAGR